MHLFILLKDFLEDIKTQKTRAFLTTIAITWGTLTLILLMAFGAGLAFRMKEGLLNAGDRIIFVYNGQTSKRYEGLPIGRNIRLIEDDCDILKKSIPMIGGISPQYGRWGARLLYGDKSATTYMEGVYPTFEFLRRMYPAAGGRFLDEKDLIEKKRVVFLGSVIAGELVGKEDPIGKTITIDGVPFIIVGIMPKKLQTAMNNGPDDRRAVIPFSTFQSIYSYHYLGHILIKPNNDQDSQMIVKEIRRVLGKKYRFDPTDENALGIWDFNEAIKIQNKVFLGINIFLGVIGAMTLVIAGVGVANIMYVVVKERTREIGIKRAVGAKRRDIIFQFIFESMLIALVGGGIGLLVALGIVKMIWMIPAQEGAMQFLGRPILSNAVIVIAIGVLTSIGLLAGVFPARKAANVDPVDALRYE
jgi:putative ABC transport system permease protein